jgi:hypothetical protein
MHSLCVDAETKINQHVYVKLSTILPEPKRLRQSVLRPPARCVRKTMTLLCQAAKQMPGDSA